MSALLRGYAPEECLESGYPFAWGKCPRCEGHGWIACATDEGHPQGRCRNPITTSSPEDGFEAECCDSLEGCPLCETAGSIKQLVRQQAGHRCVRCRHPFKVGESGEMEGKSAEAKAFAADLGVSVEVFDQIALDSDALGDLTVEQQRKAFAESRRTNWSDCDLFCSHGGPLRARDSYGVEWVEIPELKDGRTAADVIREVLDEHGPDAVSPVQAAWRVLTVHHLDGVKANCRWWNLASLCQRCHLEVQGKVDMMRPWPWDHTPWFQPYVAAWYAWRYLGAHLEREEVEPRMDELLALGRQEESVERMPL